MFGSHTHTRNAAPVSHYSSPALPSFLRGICCACKLLMRSGHWPWIDLQVVCHTAAVAAAARIAGNSSAKATPLLLPLLLLLLLPFVPVSAAAAAAHHQVHQGVRIGPCSEACQL